MVKRNKDLEEKALEMMLKEEQAVQRGDKPGAYDDESDEMDEATKLAIKLS